MEYATLIRPLLYFVICGGVVWLVLDRNPLTWLVSGLAAVAMMLLMDGSIEMFQDGIAMMQTSSTDCAERLP